MVRVCSPLLPAGALVCLCHFHTSTQASSMSHFPDEYSYGKVLQRKRAAIADAEERRRTLHAAAEAEAQMQLLAKTKAENDRKAKLVQAMITRMQESIDATPLDTRVVVDVREISTEPEVQEEFRRILYEVGYSPVCCRVGVYAIEFKVDSQ